MPRRRGGFTVCLSVATGCPLGCRFCQSGRLGVGTTLSAAMMRAQLVWAVDRAGGDLRRAVFMGMGEPLLAFDAMLAGLTVARAKPGPGLSMAALTVSTVGVIEGLQRWAEVGWRVKPAISLHAARAEVREWLMPVAERRWPLHALRPVLAAHRLPPGRRLMLEVTLIEGVNDGEADLAALIAWCRGLRVKVELIPLTPVAGFPERPTPPDRIESFAAALIGAGIDTHIRHSLGADIAASCGALGGGIAAPC